MALSTGSSIFSLISNEETEILKKLFNSSGIFYHLVVRASFFPSNFMLLLELPLFEKYGLTVFQNNLLSKEGFSLLKNFLRPFL